MAQRLSISIPDDLYNKIQMVKENLNISGICQEAIMNAVEMEMLKSNACNDLNSLVIRLKTERKMAGEKFKRDGFSDGTKDAYRMSFEDIYFIYLHQDAMKLEELFEWGATKETRKKIAEKIDYSPFLDFEEISDFYFKGWVDAYFIPL